MRSAYVRLPTAGACRACATTPAVTAAGRGLRSRRPARTCPAADEAAEPGVPLADAGRGDIAARVGRADDRDRVAGRQVAHLRLARLGHGGASAGADLHGGAV